MTEEKKQTPNFKDGEKKTDREILLKCRDEWHLKLIQTIIDYKSAQLQKKFNPATTQQIQLGVNVKSLTINEIIDMQKEKIIQAKGYIQAIDALLIAEEAGAFDFITDDLVPFTLIKKAPVNLIVPGK